MIDLGDLASARRQRATQLPAGRDSRKSTASPGEGSPAAVATTGQPGTAEVHDHGVIHVGDRDIHLRAGRLDDDVPVTWLAIETDGVATELLALNALKVELLIGRLTAAHRWMVGDA